MNRVINVDNRGEVMIPEDPQPAWYQVLDEERTASRQSLRKPIMAGIIVIAVGFGGFFSWAFTAELDSAAVASGSVIVDSRKKVVNHFEGGILKKLLVEEGDRVKAGQTLMLLDGTRSESELGQLRGERYGLIAKLARLRAEQSGRGEIDFPEQILNAEQDYVADILLDEKRLFGKRNEVYDAKRNAQAKQIEQFDAEARALESQINARTRQEKLVAEQLKGIRQLAEKGFATRTQLVEIENNWSDLVGDMGEFKAQKAAAEQQKAEAEINLASIEMEWQSDIATEIQEAQLALNDVTQRIRASEDVLNRREVKAPQDGIVANIQIRTPGGVISPAEPIMDIIPENEPLLIEAMINRQDIDSVHVGSKAQIKLTAYSQRRLAPLDGEVRYVAADQTVDEKRDSSYYIVRAAINPDALAKRDDIEIRPGMPADILILKSPRRAIDYLIDPITESMSRAFRED
ncbi:MULTISPECIES: HlyD family type I secretion periplasmic adaptor subunit [Thalassospira]|jgi:HlyD family secretion protein|uniref:Membrane fusion protein (MFP) family protein n=1 Tax=Thalassospira xiamenensis TaxID=220697 RepID=A0ABR5XY03_9PROT|nr:MULTISPECIES: HlyD family type I secretion periplasmic adaptor subunit [Thalassospira]MBR9778632.1 HlyD family type I secretion periplasmic adaptor subunit [Rhodospirillales bacterium]KZC97292.1 hemolysin secretion protein D [Thalassospira xiamenensis]KZD10113.1 hemolysin secretion protein D [Thalassospira xiamenensis]MAB34940.1 HlyD family type I secretion periplasmic adaptor subunit [Thalassospira sp.]MAL30721.1 HlyD family type I secretion periplasmic adaptor subunit [Thalassospira sp.]|tara:strand:+ start:849 stop:2231 length:1383 start_codon:yes stop_codon:yes gene_type:complete